MKKIIQRLMLVVVTLSFFVVVVPTSFAQEGQGGVAAILEQIKSELKEFKKDVSDYYGLGLDDYKEPNTSQTPDLALTKEVATTVVNTKKFGKNDFITVLNALMKGDVVTLAPPGSEMSMTSEFIHNILTTVRNAKVCGSRDSACRQATRDAVLKQMAGMNISNIYDPDNNHAVTPSSYQQARAPNPNNNMLNLDSVLSPLAFRDIGSGGGATSAGASAKAKIQSQADLAKQFVKYATGLSDPLALREILPLSADPQTETEREEYVVTVRNYAAQMSVGLSNFDHMIARRIPNPSMENPRSQLQIEHNLATRRMAGDWHDKMEKASPLAVQREMVFLLAELNYQLYLQRVMQERMLATMSMVQLENLQIFSKAVIQAD